MKVALCQPLINQGDMGKQVKTSTVASVLVAEALEKVFADKNIKSCTQYLSAIMRIRVSRVAKSPKTYRVTIGRPNYAENEYLKWCKKLQKPMPRHYLVWYKKPAK